MPNIEIHGYGPGGTDNMMKNRAAVDARRRIWKALDGAEYLKDVVVSDVYTTTTNCDGIPQPFLRIVSSGEAQAVVADIEKRLTNDFDIEVMPLLRFVPKPRDFVSMDDPLRRPL